MRETRKEIMHRRQFLALIGFAFVFAAVNAACVDNDARCAGWASSGECISNPSYMLKNCRKSCKECGATCTDKETSCSDWADAGYCAKSSQWYGYMRDNCQMSCEFCVVADSTANIETCDDIEVDCGVWKKGGFCNKNNGFYDFMKENCKKTCGFCPKKKVKKMKDNCKDTFDTKQCQDWAKRGECERNPAWMKENCKKSCKICKSSEGTGSSIKGSSSTGSGSTAGSATDSVTSTSDSSGTSDKASGKNDDINDVLCGLRLKLRVVGGNATAAGDWPWQIGLARKRNPSKVICGGSLINKQWVVTAAHCFGRAGPLTKKPGDYVIRIAEHDLAYTSGAEKVLPVMKIIRHEGYKIFSYDNDITLLKLEEPLKYSHLIKPVCLPKQGQEDKGGEWCYVTGWGRTGEFKSTAKVLQEARIPIVNEKTCKNTIGVFSTYTKNMICAGYKEGKIDACQGDSGGPFVCNRGGRFQLAGVVSWGRGCARANSYGVYAKVSNYVDWIKTTIKNE